MDSQDFESLIFETPSQIQLGIEASKNIRISKKPDQIVFCGMGGSALAGDLLKVVFGEYKIKIPIIIHKDYDLPLTVTKNSLIVCASYSGNTEETLSAYKKAVAMKVKAIAMASGGQLEKLAIKNKTPYIGIDLKNIPPRLSVLYMFSSLVGLLVKSSILPGSAFSQLKSSAKNINVSDVKNLAFDIAVKAGSKTPLIYSSARISPLAYIMKINFNENAKIHAFSNALPECQHNEIQGFSDESLNKNFYPIFLKDKKDHPRISKRIDVMAEMITRRNFSFSIIDLNLKSIFDKIIFSLFFGGFASLRLAQLKDQDPIAVPLIEELKSALRS